MNLVGIFLSFFIIVVARGASVVGCSWILKSVGTGVSAEFQILIWVSGLKGVIAFALASRAIHDFENGDIMITITLIYSILGVFFM
jgi:hypothetical protein